MVNNKRKAAAEKAVATKAAKRAQKGAKHPPTTTTVTTSNPTPAANANVDAAARRRGVMKQLCDCEQHKGLNEFEQFPISGDVLIPACAFRCPYCTYACSSKGHKGSTVRKHVRNMHIKTGHYPSLQMAQGSSGHPHHRLEKVVDLPPADETLCLNLPPAVPPLPGASPPTTSGLPAVTSALPPLPSALSLAIGRPPAPNMMAQWRSTLSLVLRRLQLKCKMLMTFSISISVEFW